MAFQLGDHVRFRGGMAIEHMRGRKRRVGVVVALMADPGPEPWPIVQFGGYMSPALQPAMLEAVTEPGAGDDDAEMAK